MISDETRKAFRLDDTQLLKWRAGGRFQKAKTLLLVAGVGLLILAGIRMMAAAPLQQQGPGPRMGRQFGPEQQLERLSQRLHLTDEQKAKIKPILEDQHKQMMALRQDTSLSREDRFAKFQQIRKESSDKIRSILNPDQQKEWDQMQQMRERRARRWSGGPGGVN